jgi:hypothetical protein
VVRAFYIRSVAAVYVIAFVSFWRQAHGLIGERGILPAASYLQSAAEQLGTLDAVLRLPTLLWLGAGDQALHLLCITGVTSAFLGVIGWAPAICLSICWVCYLSIVHAGQVFFSYQWDTLLLEAGLLTILWAPMALWPQFVWPGTPPRAALWLSRWLLFRLMWSSGVVKLLSGDPTWRSLSATHFHYETQPIPSWVSHFAHHLPPWFHTLEVVFTLGIELILPLAIFGPRRWRLAAVAGFVLLQLCIALTGNYGFFNLLSLVLCLPLLTSGWWSQEPGVGPLVGPVVGPPGRNLPAMLVLPVALVLFLSGAMNLTATVGRPLGGIPWLQPVERALAPLHLSSRYGLFAWMTTKREEIVVEGSQDGSDWEAYEFHWKPSHPARRPSFAVLHMPRLDWQLWFAALRGYEKAPWFGHFAARLLEAEPSVLGLMFRDPFDGTPPHYLRARLFDYHFSSPDQRSEGIWWNRTELRSYTPELSLSPRGSAGGR